MDSDRGSGVVGLGLRGSGGGGVGRGGSGSGSGSGGGGGGGGENTSAIGGGGASADAWTRLVSSGVEDDLVLVGAAGGAGSGAGGLPYGHFLDACFLCRKLIASNRDIYMYRGDVPFCSEECRREQIDMDEEMERKEKNTSKKLSARSAPPRDVDSPPRPPKTRAGSILAG